MEKIRRYRGLTEAEKRYIDNLVNEEWGSAIRDFGNGIKQGFNDFHNNLYKNRQMNKAPKQNKEYDPLSMSPFEVAKNKVNPNEGMPTERSQWTQLKDFIGDIVTDGKHSREKNDQLNQMMRRDIRSGRNTEYWNQKLLNYWGWCYDKNVEPQIAAEDFEEWYREVIDIRDNAGCGKTCEDMKRYIASKYGNGTKPNYKSFLSFLGGK